MSEEGKRKITVLKVEVGKGNFEVVEKGEKVI